ncbi:hypothetical protein HDU92_007898 [Lobulomyces angularis]|nr:hypothetical protein HDU92_007898 [Lobulomyces angularis]
MSALLETTDIILIGLVSAVSVGYFVWKSKSSKPAGPIPVKTPIALPTKQSSFIKLAEEDDNPNQAILFFGSQTGTAEDLATRFAKDLTDTYGINTIVCDFEDYDMEELENWPLREDLEAHGKKWLACFFIATYGEGEPTDNAADFYEWVMNGQGKGPDEAKEDDHMTEGKVFSQLSFTAFGLGNKTYEHYNAMVRRLARRLSKCGATLVTPFGEGDDDGSLEEDFLNWKDTALPAIAEYFGAKAVEKKDLPHTPLFIYKEISKITPQLERNIYYGEWSSSSPRRWKTLIPSADGTETFVSDVAPRYTEVRLKRPVRRSSTGGSNAERRNSGIEVIADMKHPYYSRMVLNKPLYSETENFDEFAFDLEHTLPESNEHYKAENGKIRINRQCYHIELDIEGTGIRYKTGDHIGIWAENDPTHVLNIARVLGVENKLDQFFELKPNPKNKTVGKLPFSLPCSIRTALTYYVDLRIALKQHHFEILSKYTKEEIDKEILWKLSSDREFFVNCVEKPQKTLYDILTEFPSVKVPLEVVLAEILPKNTLRYYSISSSSVRHPNKVSMTAVVVRYALANPAIQEISSNSSKKKVIIRQGLVTSYFQRLYNEKLLAVASNLESDKEVPIPKFHLPMYIRTSTFRLPADLTVPIIMVGPGTGVAPFRGFLWERFTAAEEGLDVGSTILFYGCRHPDLDWLYRGEMEDMMKRNLEFQNEDNSGKHFDLEIKTAFSRVPGKVKVYVQHLLKEEKQKVWDILSKKNGNFYVCGDAKNMAHAVNNTLIEIASEMENTDIEGGKNWLKDLKAAGRYSEDTW